MRAEEDLKGDWDVALYEARRAATVRVRDATARENASRGVTFSFFNDFFLPLDPVPSSVEAAQPVSPSTSRSFGHPGSSLMDINDEQLDFDFE